MVGGESDGFQEIGLVAFAEGQALVAARKDVPNTLLVDYEYRSIDDATGRISPAVLAFRDTPDAVRSFTELYALAAGALGWDTDVKPRWTEIQGTSAERGENPSKALKKPKGFTRG